MKTRDAEPAEVRAMAERFELGHSRRFRRPLAMTHTPSELALLAATSGTAAERAVRLVWDLINHGWFMDTVLFDPRHDGLGDVFFDLWKELTEKEFLPGFPPVEALRVLPPEEVIRTTRVLDIDSVRSMVRGARRARAALRCPPSNAATQRVPHEALTMPR
jgi:hypothetical protein